MELKSPQTNIGMFALVCFFLVLSIEYKLVENHSNIFIDYIYMYVYIGSERDKDTKYYFNNFTP